MQIVIIIFNIPCEILGGLSRYEAGEGVLCESWGINPLRGVENSLEWGTKHCCERAEKFLVCTPTCDILGVAYIIRK